MNDNINVNINDKDNNNDSRNKKYDGNEMAIVLFVPENTVRLKVEASVLNSENSTVFIAETIITPKEIMDARHDYLTLDPYDNAFDVYRLTEEGVRYIEEMKNNKSNTINTEELWGDKSGRL